MALAAAASPAFLRDSFSSIACFFDWLQSVEQQNGMPFRFAIGEAKDLHTQPGFTCNVRHMA